ncbi:MAG: hypothetical protein V2A66_10425 [Pseudomonadota bacterium]
MKLFRLNKKGVALLVVLTAIAALTTMAISFSYNTNVSYHLAVNEQNRLKSYYLAKSAYNFMLLELKFDRVFRQAVQSQNLGQYLGGNAQLPLCQQFPMSTGLIRAVFTGGGLPGMGGGEEGGAGPPAAEGGEAAEGEAALEKMRKGTSISEEKSAAEFLDFEGDFDAECIDESTKIDLNSFAGLKATAAAEGASPLDQYKIFLLKFLSRPQFELLFREDDLRIPDVVGNIADWIDKDAGGNKGAARAVYEGAGIPYAARNGKLLTLLEAYLIDGVMDDWFAPLMDMFTIYGDGRINVCTASLDVVEGLIHRYVDSTPSLPPLRLEDPVEMKKLTDAVLMQCSSGATGDQLKAQISSGLDAAIGAVSSGTPVQPPAAPGQPAPGQAPGAAPGGPPQYTGFAAYLNTASRYFTLKLAGQIHDTTTRIKVVIDIKDNDPKKWKLLYWKVY